MRCCRGVCGWPAPRDHSIPGIPVYEEHPATDPPLAADTVLWRYLDFTKFISLLDRQALFLARADALGDPFEGSLARANVAKRQIVHKDMPPHARGALAQAFRSMTRFILINCWHEGDHESAAMWRLYSRWQNGLAIRSTFKSLSESFTCNSSVYIGRVQYVDYKTAVIPEDNIFALYMHKRRSFEYEREVRVLTMELPPNAGGAELSRDVCDVGMYYSVDVAKLVEEVVFAPHAEDWFVELVQSVAARYNLKVPVRRSSLADAPTWG